MICIDGARLASSHLVRRTADILARHLDAFTFVGSRHLGPKLQKLSIEEGYNQAIENELLSSVAWTTNLDNLYAISVWAGAHQQDNVLLQNESNAFAMARKTWDSVGGYKEGFDRPGGGLCYLELFSRYVTRRKALSVLLYGEATFHQVHNIPLKSHDYFGGSMAEYVEVTGESYRRPSFPFFADLGERYNRMQALGEFCWLAPSMYPRPIGNTGWLRLRPCTCDFSSTHNTKVLSGGFRGSVANFGLNGELSASAGGKGLRYERFQGTPLRRRDRALGRALVLPVGATTSSVSSRTSC